MIPDQKGSASPAEARAVAPVELREVVEQLVLAGLREHALADQLRRQLAFSSALMGSLAEGVYALDPAGLVTFVNPAAERMLGRMEADLLGTDAGAIVQGRGGAPGGAAASASPLVEVLRAGATYRNEQAVFTRKDGTTFPVAYAAAPIVTDREVVGAVVAFHDLTDVLRLQQLQEEYLELLSHDLRAPLSVILGHARLLLRRLVQPALERDLESVEAIVESGVHLNQMIQDVLDRSRLVAGEAPLNLAHIDLGQLILQTVEQNVTAANAARIKVEADVQRVVAEPGLIERVIVNLLTNALKYSAPASPVVVRVFQVGRDAVVSVTDQGVGIAADDLPHLFEKHYRAGTARTTAGTGLGLYGSQLIVAAHGGRIWAESTVGQGSTFMFSLPLSGP